MGKPDYFEIAKGLMIAKAHQMPERVRITTDEDGTRVFYKCDQCGEEFELECGGSIEGDKFYCSPECKSNYIEENDDGFCVMCDGTGEGQFDGASCPACKGKGFIRGASHDDF